MAKSERMMPPLPQLRAQLEREVQTKTSRRVRELIVELSGEQVVLRGRANSYYIKQLAQQSIRDVVPHLSLRNAIVVDSSR